MPHRSHERRSTAEWRHRSSWTTFSDGTETGTAHRFLSARAMATMEFLQQEWINNGNFMSLSDERDPNVGLQEDGAILAIPHAPVRRRIHGIETFNVVRGGEYFFL